MKKKADFVTNSSSASFILTLQATDPDSTLEQFEHKFNTYLDAYRRSTKWSSEGTDAMHFWQGLNIKEGATSGIFTIKDWTSMYNGPSDVPRYMREMMVRHFIEGFAEYGFRLLNFTVEED